MRGKLVKAQPEEGLSPERCKESRGKGTERTKIHSREMLGTRGRRKGPRAAGWSGGRSMVVK